jgi:uncharacterized protein (TIGR02996 family)
MTLRPWEDVWTAARILSLAPDEASIPAARDVLRKGGLATVERESNGRGWWAVSRGRIGDYQVVVRHVAGDDFDCTCTCPSYKRPCKHALALLLYLLDHPELRVEQEAPTRSAADFEGLLRAVFRQPKDNTPRLVLADYLEEAGQSDRAKLIRVQCEMARLSNGSRRRRALRREEKELLKGLRPVFEGLRADPSKLEVVRGFVRVDLTGYWWAGWGPAITDPLADLFRDGWVESVRLQIYRSLDAPLLNLLRHAGELDFTRSSLDESALLALAEAAHGEGSRVGRVKVHRSKRALYEAFVAAHSGSTTPAVRRPANQTTARYLGLTTEQLGVLVRSGQLDGLRVLGIDGPIGDDGARALAGRDGLGGLEELTLSDTRIGPAGAAALAAAGWAAGVRNLRLVGRAMDDEAFVALCRAGDLPGLTELEVDGGLIGDDAANALTRAGCSPRLARTRWDATLLTPRGAAALVGSANLPDLARCEFTGNPLEPECWLPTVLSAADRASLRVAFRDVEIVRAVSSDGVGLRVTAAERMAGRRLEELLGGLARNKAAKQLLGAKFTGFRMDPRAVRALAGGLSRARLAALELPGNGLGNDGAAAVAEAFAGHRLTSLDLADNNIRRSGAEALAGSTVLSRVEVLDLSQNNIGLPGLLAVVESAHAAALRRLVIKETGLSKPDQKELRKRSRSAIVL